MASFFYLYNEIKYKVEQAALLLKEIREENTQLKKELQKATQEVELLKEKVSTLEEKNIIIGLSKTLSRNDKKENIKILNEFVREIDTCIKTLNGDRWETKK